MIPATPTSAVITAITATAPRTPIVRIAPVHRRRPPSKPPALARGSILLPTFDFLLFTFVVTRKATQARLATVLESIPNVGVSIARDLRSIGIKKPRDLIGRNPYSLYRMLCDRTRTRQDPCVLDTFISAVDFMEGAPARPWWSYTAARKKKFHLLSRAVVSAKAGPPTRGIAVALRRK
jgi:Pathogenicity locus